VDGILVLTGSRPAERWRSYTPPHQAKPGEAAEGTQCIILLADGTEFETVIYSFRPDELPDAERLTGDIPPGGMA
jgi:hypothetical protein